MGFLKLLLCVHFLWTFNHQCPTIYFDQGLPQTDVRSGLTEHQKKQYSFLEEKSPLAIIQNQPNFKNKGFSQYLWHYAPIVPGVEVQEEYGSHAMGHIHFQFKRLLLFPFHSFP